MTNQLTVDVRYRHIPKDVVDDINRLSDKNINVTLHHDRLEHFNATGGVTDIIIYINDHFTELVSGGLIVNAVYDGLKFCIRTTWKKLIKYYSSRKSNYRDESNSITLSFKIKPDKTIEYHLEGTVSDNSIDKITDRIFDHLQDSKEIDNHFNNPEFQDGIEEKPKIRMRYNKATDKWEPVNYANIRKEMDDILRKAENDFNG
jgi:hypothetical protein